MEAMRQSWTDERLDEFGKRVDERFDRVDERSEDQARETNRRFDEVGRRLDGIDGRIESMQAMMERRFDTLQYALIYVVVGMFGAMTAAFVGLIATQL